MIEQQNQDYRFAKLPVADILLELKNKPKVEPESLMAQRSKPLVIIDTNVWLDILYWHDAQVETLGEKLQSRALTVCVTLETVEELADVISRKQFGLDDLEQRKLVTRVLDQSVLVQTPPASHVKCRDADDQKFLDLAQSVKADYLITKDKLVLKAGKRLKSLGTRTLEPKAFEALFLGVGL